MNLGTRVHDRFSDKENRNSVKRALVSEYLHREIKDLKRVEWLPNQADSTVRHSSLPLTGRPDGIIYFQNGSKSIIELKTIDQLPSRGRGDDFIQAEIYALLLEKHQKLNRLVYVLYQSRTNRELKLFSRIRSLNEYDLIKTVSKIERGIQFRDELSPAKSAKQCSSCGYRSICSARLAS
ncbi:MAG: Dna2/Cas4 domain-containing protein [Proteobacteria bacterium]|nr:MAG: Dna2/Cas4 domain-containing protein [Pseudomonadota bacterium]